MSKSYQQVFCLFFPFFLLMVLRDWGMFRFSCIFVRFSLSFFSLIIGAFFIQFI
ncbi:hypothetical protein HMPREF3226_02244 [Prevotella corporis]|uniref:Uncharacterized protein n=1 Tax=Prevotella corporis TaxID=28128 RepID=A0A133PXA5_9BACT|nr:hypothetical protein HMPREF3226_02244 [Prevotella corporis]